MSYMMLILLTLVNLCINEGPQRNTTLKSPRKKPTFAALVFSSNTNLDPSEKVSCQWLKRSKHQLKLCKGKEGLPEVLHSARRLSISQCHKEFKFDHWNCSKLDFSFIKMYRETAYMSSLTSAALTFSVARGCADRTLYDCCRKKKDKNFRVTICDDNVKFAKRFTKKFLQLGKKGDILNTYIKYNAEIGMNVVLETEKRECKCFGVSGTCTSKVCYKRIAKFELISKQLKSLYHSAIQAQAGNNIRALDSGKSEHQLLYLENDRNFCPMTVGRQCSSTANCATLCCGRDKFTSTVTVVNNTCNCMWNPTLFNVTCESCMQDKTIFTCT